MADINAATFSGRLTRDAELKTTKGGTQVLSFSVAVNSAQKNQDGSWGDYPNYLDCTYYGKGAEKISTYMTKGRQLTVLAEVRQRRWQDQSGANRSAIEFKVNEISLASSGDKTAVQKPAPAPQPQRQTEAYSQTGVMPDDDIPF